MSLGPGKGQILRVEKMIQDHSIRVFLKCAYHLFLYDFYLAQQLWINRKYNTIECWFTTKLS